MNYLFFLGLIFGYLISMGYSDADRMLFLQAIWSNGDRTPLETFPNDLPRAWWSQGFGELTPRGMQQQLDLGTTLRQRYVENLKFLNGNYKSDEIYIRSTDLNRTITSATATLLGMYPGSDKDDAGFSYPDMPEWPKGYVPIAVHTLSDFYDYTLNPDSICKRFDELKDLIEETPEYQNFTNQNKEFLDKLSKIVGETVTLSNISKIADILNVERIWNVTMAPDVDDELISEVNKINDIVEAWHNGLGLKPYNNADFSIEIPKIRGGSLLWSLIGNMQLKRACALDPKNAYCPFYKNLYYYAYSAHDTTLAALFSTLKLNYTNWNEDEYPQYSSCVTIEFWQKADKTDYIKFMHFTLDPELNEYHNKGEELVVPDCKTPNKTRCNLDEFADNSNSYKPTPDAATLCATPLGQTPQIITTTVKPVESSANKIFMILAWIPLIFGFILLN